MSRRPAVLLATLGMVAMVLIPVGVALPNHVRTLPAPTPIPGGLQIPDGPLLQIFLPGPEGQVLPFSGLPLQGRDVEPSTITDRDGFTALAYLIGTATDGEGNEYNLEADIRVFRGEYIAADGTHHRGLFAML